MIPAAEYFRSVEWIWVIWLSCFGLFVAIVYVTAGAGRKNSLVSLLRSEEGATYTLPYVMTFPWFMLLICLLIESSLILIVKQGSVYAAYAAARSAVVWLPAEPKGRASERIHLAAAQAMTPFASSTDAHARQAGVTGGVANAARYNMAYQRFAGHLSSEYVIAKYRFAAHVTKVTWSPQRPRGNAPVTVTVTFETPLHVPGVGRILGHPAPWPGRGYSYLLRSQATMPNEGPVGAESQKSGHPMGIEYTSI